MWARIIIYLGHQLLGNSSVRNGLAPSKDLAVSLFALLQSYTPLDSLAASNGAVFAFLQKPSLFAPLALFIPRRVVNPYAFPSQLRGGVRTFLPRFNRIGAIIRFLLLKPILSFRDVVSISDIGLQYKFCYIYITS